MDDVVELFQGLEGPNNSTPVTIFDDLYKNCGRLGNQNERRKELLERQKRSRSDNLDRHRGILDLVNEVEDSENRLAYGKAYYRPSIYVAGFHKVARSYKHVLMYSEWLVSKPDDFSDNWFIVPCPKGVRMLVVASRGITQCYTKYGQFKLKTSTALPGGNKHDKNTNPCSVLDCFYVETNNTLYILDVLAWNNMPMTDCKTEFRHYWMTSKFAENPELSKVSKKNKLLFKLLPKIPCATNLLNDFLSKYPPFETDLDLNLDGFLFYHKMGHYISGETPLVGWLFSYMVKEILGEDLTLHDSYLATMPIDYVNQGDFIQRFEAINAKKKGRQRRTSESTLSSNNSAAEPEMETDVIEGTGDATASQQRKKKGKRAAKNIESPEEDNVETQMIGDLLNE